jgi:hypothetical protein
MKNKEINNDCKNGLSRFIVKFKVIKKEPINRPAKNPSIVLFGEIFSASFLLPTLFPIS